MTESNESEHKERRYPRVKARILYRPPKVFGQKRQAPDISLGGMRIYSNKLFQQGSTHNIEIFLPSGQTAMVLARVAWVDAYPKDSDALYDIGLEFIHVPNNIADDLKSVLESTPSDK